MTLFWMGLALTLLMPAVMLVGLTLLHVYLRITYLDKMVRIFQEKPLFIVPRGQPVPEAEEVVFPNGEGQNLRGCYLRCEGPRRGVILFGLEFGSNRWACVAYCQHLLQAGYDIFAFEPRNQGDSDSLPGYEPLQWVTDYEVRDMQAALEYLKNRPDADPNGIGFFGISKGGGAGLLAAARDRYVRCFITDGIFATYSTLVPYMRHWYRIYNSNYAVQGLLPSWYYGIIGRIGLRQIERARRCHFPALESAIARLSPRPLLMIHGGADTYIKPEMARKLFDRAREPKEFWLVEGARHNQAFHLANAEYQRRVREFFDRHLAGDQGASASLTRRQMPSAGAPENS